MGEAAATAGRRLRVAVAASGGRDSTALLHVVRGLAQRHGFEVIALHVHHGLQPAADAWLVHLRRQCARWGVSFDARRLQGGPSPGESVEAWARRGRYAALAEMARAAGCGTVLLAHHRRDQAETVLLQLLRGAGAAGLAAMPRVAHREGIAWLRPWLSMPREAIEAYVRRHRLGHVDDHSNRDPRHARNRLRRTVWPALLRAFPHAEASLASAAARAAEESAWLRWQSARDAAAVCDARGLDLKAWSALPPAGQPLALRAWLEGQREPGGVPHTLVARLLRELPRAKAGRWPFGRRWLLLERGHLAVAPCAAAPDGDAAAPGASRAARSVPPAPRAIDLSTLGRHEVPPWGGSFEVRAVRRDGIALSRLAGARLVARAGGETFRLAPRASDRSLKKQYQAVGVPPGERRGPLVVGADGALLFVPGLGMNAAERAAAGEPQGRLVWHASAPCGPATKREPAPGGRAAAAPAVPARRRP